MKGSSSSPRSYLHQLAEPVPHSAALLTLLRPIERGASLHSALDAIPPILDSISDPLAEAAASQHKVTARSTRARRAQTSLSRGLSVSTQLQPGTEPDNSSQPASSPSTAARRASTTLAGDEALQRPDNATRETLSSRETQALQDKAALHSEDRRQFFAHATSATARIAAKASPHADPNHVARNQSRQGIRVHIGTVEVRSAAPVEPKPAPAIDRSARTGRSGAAAEPLSRGLAWSHGLVQG